MAYLSGKRILITGLLSNRSIAYGIAKLLKQCMDLFITTYIAIKNE